MTIKTLIALGAQVSVMTLVTGSSAFAQGASDGGRGNARFVKATSYLPANQIAGGFRPNAIVLHRLSGSLKGAVAYMTAPTASVSCHYLVGKNGDVVQLVQEKDAAYHVKNFNRSAFCVEFEGYVGEALTAEQIARGREIVQGLEKDKQISKVLVHKDLAQDRDCAVSDDDLKSILN